MKLRLGVCTLLCSSCLLAGGLSIGAGSASAVPMWSDIPGQPGTQYHDTDIDYFTNLTGGATTIDEGDVLTAVLSYSNAYQLHNYSTAGQASANLAFNDLNAVTTIKVLNINYTDATHMVVSSIDFGAVNSSTPMVQFYTGTSLGDPKLAETETLATVLGKVTSGTFLASFSLVGPGDFWSFTPGVLFAGVASLNVATVANGLPTQTVGSINFALDEVDGLGLFGPIDNGVGGFADLTGTGSISGGRGNGWNSTTGLNNSFANSTSEAFLNPVPEPATMSLFGLGLMGLGFIGSRRKRS